MLLWFRNDLRTIDNPALHHFWKNTSIKSDRKAIFFVSNKQWQAHDWSAIKIDFIKRHASALANELKRFNIQLSIVNAADFNAQIAYLANYCQQHNIQHIYANSELEFNEQQRDKTLISQGIPLKLFEADVIAPKGKILNKSGEMFKVFTPFKKAWLSYVKLNGFEYLGKTTTEVKHALTLDVDADNETSISAAWPLAQDYLDHHFPLFLQDKLACYSQQRDIPSIKGTSGLSPYLAAGVISPRYVLTVLLNKHPDLLSETDRDTFTWLNEIIWREFYRHLLFHQQKLCKHHSFKEKYQTMIWPNNPTYFTAWCEGKTGYPLVDAAMKQFNKTGWMHNRLRMVVASFLTKHLLVDWRLGEQYFMQHLIDGDLAANNGGWQWAASTGCDSQPYFRIFNPIKQSERFDPKGDFIRKYLPELSEIPDKYIHFPHPYIKDNQLTLYVRPLVDHKEARLKALTFYQ